VRLAGVDIGSVKGVRPHPELKQMPVEVQMVIRTPYELNIPNDSTASLETAGVLGETFVEIDSVAASGPPLRQNEVLKSKTTNAVSVEQIIKNFGDKIRMKDCGCEKPATGPDVKSRPQTDVPR
jgi:phospholipid/cholesterol/gamma-HCH transport system substrate-binding protein